MGLSREEEQATEYESRLEPPLPIAHTDALTTDNLLIPYFCFLHPIFPHHHLHSPTMPSGTGVVDAFKSLFHSLSLFLPLCLPGSPRSTDLIRHGKNHHNAKTHDSDQHHSSPSQVQQQHNKQPREQQPRESREQQPQTQDQTATPKFKDEVEKIVQEEREAKSKMPTYQGLENFKLVEKMGEYVFDVLFLFIPSQSIIGMVSIISGAFSNVYKAIDLRNGEKVAGKSFFSFPSSCLSTGLLL